MSEAAEERVNAALKTAALRAGLVDMDWLKLVDTSKVTLGAYGEVKGADELVAGLKAAKPFLFGKRASEMTPQEAAAKLAELKRGPKPEPLPIDRTAKEMTEAQRRKWLAEHNRRFG
jgi:hypothetical protein